MRGHSHSVHTPVETHNRRSDAPADAAICGCSTAVSRFWWVGCPAASRGVRRDALVAAAPSDALFEDSARIDLRVDRSGRPLGFRTWSTCRPRPPSRSRPAGPRRPLGARWRSRCRDPPRAYGGSAGLASSVGARDCRGPRRSSSQAMAEMRQPASVLTNCVEMMPSLLGHGACVHAAFRVGAEPVRHVAERFGDLRSLGALGGCGGELSQADLLSAVTYGLVDPDALGDRSRSVPIGPLRRTVTDKERVSQDERRTRRSTMARNFAIRFAMASSSSMALLSTQGHTCSDWWSCPDDIDLADRRDHRPAARAIPKGR